MGSQQIVRAWLAYDLTRSELALGMVTFVVAVPMFLMGPLGGAIADRNDRRKVIALGQATVVLSELAILLLLTAGLLQYWHLLVGAAVMGCVFPFIMPARQAIVVNIVGKEGLANAMALNMAGMNTTRVVGPMAAGLLIGTLGVAGTYAVGVSLYLIALLCLTRLHSSVPEGTARQVSIARNIREGLRYITEERLVLILLFFGIIPMFLAMPFQSLLPVFAVKIWDSGSVGLGMLSAAGAVGGLAGSIWVAWQSDSHHRLFRMMVSMLGFGVFLALFSLSPWFLLALPLVFIANVFASVYGTLNNTAVQLLIPDHLRGRVSSFLLMSFSLPLLGTLPVSAVAEVYGAPFAVAAAAILAILVSVAFYLGSPKLRGMDSAVRRAMSE